MAVGALTGRCDCGAVRISIPSVPDRINACPCDYCRRIGARWGYFPAGSVAIEGATHRYDRVDRIIDFHRCATCGTPTHWTGKAATGRPAQMGVHMQNFDQAALRDVPVVVGARPVPRGP